MQWEGGEVLWEKCEIVLEFSNAHAPSSLESDLEARKRSRNMQ
jgi:hypothetical protein